MKPLVRSVYTRITLETIVTTSVHLGYNSFTQIAVAALVTTVRCWYCAFLTVPEAVPCGYSRCFLPFPVGTCFLLFLVTVSVSFSSSCCTVFFQVILFSKIEVSLLYCSTSSFCT